LIDVSRIAAGKLSIHPQRVKLEQVAGAAIESVHTLARDKAIRIEFWQNGADTTVMGDADRLHQIAANLLSNAIKFTHDGAHVLVSVDADDRNVTLTVRDNGRTRGLA
jgi:signal transduction histidine kinase